MPTLSSLDLAIVFCYLVGMTLFGVWFTRKQKDLRTYFVGDRNVGWFLVLMSIVATETSAVTFLSVPGVAFNPKGGNLTYLQLSFGYIVGRCLVAWLLLPLYMQGNLFSAYEVLRQRFGPSVQRVASAIFLLTRTVADGLRLFLTALIMQFVLTPYFPDSERERIDASIVLVGIVTIIYTYLGGMKAVLWTDLIQFVIKVLGAVLAGVFVLKLLPGGADQVLMESREAGKLTLFDFQHAFDPTVPFNFWAGLIGGAVFSMASHGADQMMVQRYLCARSLGQARLALVLSGFVVTVQFALFLFVGLGMWTLMHAGLFPEAAGRRTDEVFGLFIVSRLPVGIVGLLVAAVLAAAMSTLASSLNSSANALVTDFYKPLRPGRGEGHYVTRSRILTAVWGVAQMGVAMLAYRFGGDKSIVEQVLKVAGLTTGLLLGLFVLGSLPWKIESRAALIGLLAGFVVVLGLWLPEGIGAFAKSIPDDPHHRMLAGMVVPRGMTQAVIAWPWFALIGAGTTTLVGLLANFGRSKTAVTSPHNPPNLQENPG
ncbi:MAG: sodium:solute symporter [Gemmataceae bacterium]